MRNFISKQLIFIFALATSSFAVAQEVYAEPLREWKPASGLYFGPSNKCDLKLYHRGDSGFATETTEISSSGARCSIPGSVDIYSSEDSSYLSSIDNYNRRNRIQPLNPLNDREFIISYEVLSTDGIWVVKGSYIFRRK